MILFAIFVVGLIDDQGTTGFTQAYQVFDHCQQGNN
jgi:hypothetical protein